MSKFGDALEEFGIDPAKLAAQSAAMEAFHHADRERMAKRADARRSKKSYDESEAPKPERYGRGVSLRTISNAIAGRPTTQTNRKKLVRAMNGMLTHSGKDPVDVPSLFEDAPRKKVSK